MEYLNKPLKVKNVTLKNRLVMPPMATEGTDNGEVNKKILDYYNEKTEGGYIGLVIIEHCYVNIQGKASPKQMSVSKDSDIEGLRALADTIHANGSKAIAQISHAGSAASEKITGCKAISASAIPNFRHKDGEPPIEMSKEKITQTIKDFADAARRVKRAGFDGVEIHSAHGYLLNQFYSPLTNKRNDEYSARTIENRLRFHKEIINAVREEVGEDFIVAVRLGGCDYMENGSTIEDGANAAKLLEEYGVDIMDISGGMNGTSIPGVSIPGYFSGMSKAVKQVVNTPVILTGGVNFASEAEKLLSDADADLIGVGRAILKDSLWAKNAMSE